MKIRATASRELPRLTSRAVPGRFSPGVLFAVYAPFGNDLVLSGYPDETLRVLEQHPLYQSLLQVAAEGVNVAALIDLADDDTWLVEIPAWQPKKAKKFSAWKQAMNRPQALAGFLRRAHARFPCGHLVLALEGHGAGYLPEIDTLHPVPPPATPFVWRIGNGSSELTDAGGNPVLPIGGYQELPVGSPEGLPVTLPISTWGLAQALASARRDGVPRPALIHFNNCFNMALEHLHTIAPHAEVATGYTNYNYFTSGSTYPAVFARLRQAGAVPALKLARWFAEENRRPLALKGNHPGVGAAIVLKKVGDLGAAVNGLANELTKALQADRATNFPLIRATVIDALQFDTNGDFHLDVPDQSTDLGTWCAQLMKRYPVRHPIHTAAEDVHARLKGVQVYGDKGQPRMKLSETWDFTNDRIAVSILLPDPLVDGTQDWRTPYYMAGQAVPGVMPGLKAQVPFLADDAGGKPAPWPAFLDEYHRVTPLPAVKLLRIPPFVFPKFDIQFDPKGGGDGGNGQDPTGKPTAQ